MTNIFKILSPTNLFFSQYSKCLSLSLFQNCRTASRPSLNLDYTYHRFPATRLYHRKDFIHRNTRDVARIRSPAKPSAASDQSPSSSPIGHRLRHARHGSKTRAGGRRSLVIEAFAKILVIFSTSTQ